MNVNDCRGKAPLLEHTVAIACRGGDPGFSPSAHDEPAAAAAGAARRFGARPALTAAVAAHAGLGGQRHG
jgi:hypothetical protein